VAAAVGRRLREEDLVAETAVSLFDVADMHFKRGQWAQALAAFGGVIEACPSHFKSRFRVADCLLNLGRREEALEVYKAIGWHAIKAGFPLLGLVSVKMVLLLEPGYEDILVILSELYSKESDRVDAHDDGPDYPALDQSDATPLSGDDATVIDMARALAAGDQGSDFPKTLPRIPLFSHLDEDAFIEVLAKLRLRRFADDEIIVEQGERGESFYIVADGDVSIKRDVDEDGGVTLAHLHRGSVFGEMALISDDPRHASAIARGDVDVLEMRRSDLVVAASQLQGVTAALKAFTRERFLGNLTATHPLFNPLNREERHTVMDRFVQVEFADGEALITEGTQGPGLYLLLGGSADVRKHSGGERVHLANLKAADLCGEMSMIGDNPTTATVTAQEKVEALFLPREAFSEIIGEHPEIMKYLAGLTDERLRQNRAMLQSKGLLEDDEHIMI
jgi:cAMP-dependent protein kinase regulator